MSAKTRRFEYYYGDGDGKFWEITPVMGGFKVVFGKLGTNGQIRSIFGRSYQSAINEKLNKGYREVTEVLHGDMDAGDLGAAISSEGFDYFFRYYTKPKSNTQPDLAKAWYLYLNAANQLEKVLDRLGVNYGE